MAMGVSRECLLLGLAIPLVAAMLLQDLPVSVASFRYPFYPHHPPAVGTIMPRLRLQSDAPSTCAGPGPCAILIPMDQTTTDGGHSTQLMTRCVATALALLLALHAGCHGPPDQAPVTIHEAAVFGDVTLVRSHLRRGADVDTRDDGGRTPLHWAVRRSRRKGSLFGDRNKSVVKLLLAKGADVDARTNWGCTPLHFAAAWGRPDLAEVLLEKDAGVEALDEKQWTPLFLAAYHGYPDMARLLLDHGADVNRRDRTGKTPLHWAAVMDQARAIGVLVAHGADVNARNDDELTPLDIARAESCHQAVRALRRHGAAEQEE